MKQFKIVPLSKEYTDRIRQTGQDDFGHEVIEQPATGRGPCRVSLKPFNTGVDRRLLFSHSPFTIDNAYDQPGPVFINAEEVEEYSDIYRFPQEIKNDKEHFHLTLIGYDENQLMKHSELVGDRDVEEMIVEIFKLKPQVAYLHVRSAEACCYICRVERVEE